MPASRPPNKLVGVPSQKEAPPQAITEHLVFENRLQELTQKLGLPSPVCLTINEASSYAPKFRTTFVVNGVPYKSKSQHSSPESAKQEAAKIAYESITRKEYAEGCPPRYRVLKTGEIGLAEGKSPITGKFQAMAASFQPPNNRGGNLSPKEAPSQAIAECTSLAEQEIFYESLNGKEIVEGCPSLHKNPIYCKSILYEYAVKKKMNNPKYQTKCKAGFPPRFTSSVELNGEEYGGGVAESKKEAEQLAAQAAINFLLGSDSRTLVLIIKSKEIIFDLSPTPKPIYCIEHDQRLPSTIGQIPTTSLRTPTDYQGKRGPMFAQQMMDQHRLPVIKQGENPEQANTLTAEVTVTNLVPGVPKNRAKRSSETINRGQKKRK